MDQIEGLHYHGLLHSFLEEDSKIAAKIRAVFQAYKQNEGFPQLLDTLESDLGAKVRLIIDRLNEVDDPGLLEEEIQKIFDTISAIELALHRPAATKKSAKKKAATKKSAKKKLATKKSAKKKLATKKSAKKKAATKKPAKKKAAAKKPAKKKLAKKAAKKRPTKKKAVKKPAKKSKVTVSKKARKA